MVMPYSEACSAAIVYTNHFGLSVIPIGRDKRPVVAWKEFQSRRPTFDEILSWPRDGFNLAVVTGRISGGLVIVDCESRDDAKWFWDNKGQTQTIVRTKRGYHFYFQSDADVRNAQKVFDRYDVRGEGGYALIPPSVHSDGRYGWSKDLVSVASLPAFHPSWRPETSVTLNDRAIHDGQKYISRIFAVEGQGGDHDTFRAAIALRDSGLSESEALYVLLEWNKTNAQPPWDVRSLLHKVRSAYKGD